MKSILCLLVLLNGSFCLAQIHKGAYTIQREKNTSGDTSIIKGTVIEFATNKPLEVAIIKIDTTLIQTDTLGRFSYELPPGKHRIRAGFIGYYLIDTGPVNLRRRELVNVLFRVKEDTRPLVD